jgi:putative ABC transport system permease protein
MAAFSRRYLQISAIFGSSNFNRIKYYIIEALMIIVASIILCIILIMVAHQLLLKHFSLDLLQGNAGFISAIVCVFVLLCVIGGLMPFLKQQSFHLLTGSLFDKKESLSPRGISRSLIVIQYATSTALMISVIVMMRQTNYALKTSMGENSGNLICLEDMHTEVQSKFSVFKQELLKFNSIQAVTAMLDPPGGEANDMFAFEMEGYTRNESENISMIGVLPCDYSFTRVFNLKLLAGEDFSPVNMDNEGSGEFLINRSALKRLGYSRPEHIIGKNFKFLFDDIQIPAGQIIGVVDDFRLSGIKKRVEPLVMFKRGDVWLINFIISFEPGMERQALKNVEKVWKNMFPDHPFQFRYLNSIYRNVYQSELLQTTLLMIFTIMAMFIGSMGLLGLSLLTTQRRTKEIGIRMVNGAGVGEILTMLNWYFIRWILLSLVLAIPVAWYGMNKWLENFEYKVTPAIWIFALASLITIVIALVTVSFQSWNTANRNPVESLRYE